MRIRASWRDPYSGVPLMFTSSSPGCSRRDSAALPPSSTWVTERGVKGGTAPRISQGMFHGRRVSGEKEASEKVPELQAPQRDLWGQALPLLWSHEFLSKGTGEGGERKMSHPSRFPRRHRQHKGSLSGMDASPLPLLPTPHRACQGTHGDFDAQKMPSHPMCPEESTAGDMLSPGICLPSLTPTAKMNLASRIAVLGGTRAMVLPACETLAHALCPSW